MNIGIITTWYERGAAYVSKQYKDVLKKKHNVFIYSRGGQHQSKSESGWDDFFVTWDEQSVFRSKCVVNPKCFKNWLIANKIDIAFFNEQHQWGAVTLCNKLGVKTGAYIDYYTKETVPFFGCYDFLICNTKRHYSVFKWHPQAFYVPWGTETDIFKPKSMSLVSENFVIFFHSAGWSPERKGSDLVLDAFSRLSGPARLVIHSQAKLSKCFPEKAAFIESLRNKGKLDLYEQTVSAPGLYHLGDVYVYPSRLEGIGLTITEAFSCGLPVITCDNPPMNEFVNSKTGKKIKISRFFNRDDNYYWPQCEVDVNHLCQCMQFYVDNSKHLLKFKKVARDYALKDLDWRKNSNGLTGLFQNVRKIPLHKKFSAEKHAQKYDKKKWAQRQRIIGLINRNKKSYIKKLNFFLRRF